MSVIDRLLDKDHNISLPTPPTIAVNILDEVKKAEPSFTRLTKIIGTDPALTARVLRIANSPIMAPIKPIDTLDAALTRLGITIVTNIALSFVLIDNFNKKDIDLFDCNYFWQRALTAAIAANVIATAIRRPNDNVFIGALLQDIGILVAYTNIPACRDKINATISKKGCIKTAAAQCCDCSHAQLGSELLAKWGLSDSITQPILFHQHPENAPKAFLSSARIIYLADKLSATIHNRNNDNESNIKELYTKLNYFYDISSNRIHQIVEQTINLSHDLLELLNIPTKNIKNSTQLLQEANEILLARTIAADQEAKRYKREKDLAQKANSALNETNAELSRLAFQDSLTGLYNLRYFHDFFDRELQRSARYSSSFAFIMLDIDNFKAINDTYGHQAGDKILQTIAGTIIATMRSTDLVARYGGEEFAIILPETTPQVAQETAERLRKNIANTSITWQGEKIAATVSIGISFFNTHSNNLTKQQLISEADAALYRAKEQGKNRVVIAQ